MFTLRSFPKAIIHIDGDAFFASCEVARDPSLKGKPVVTGLERGIASSMSYEAKARGVTRGMQIHVIKKVCPDAIILPSDYESYSLYSKRMYEIVRRYTPDVEEYSIDECFADITGLRRLHHASYTEIAVKLKEQLDTELGMTFSVGLAPNKVLAKVASKWVKPSGFTAIPGHSIHNFLQNLPVIKLWGIGPQTAAYLNKLGIQTALEFALQTEEWVTVRLTKPHVEMWHELRGEFVYPLSYIAKHDYKSISKTKTFTPPSTNSQFVFSQLSKNVENACIKLRRHNLVARECLFFLKTQEFKFHALEVKFASPLSDPQEMLRLIAPLFARVFAPKTLYRSTGLVLMNLSQPTPETLDLFGTHNKVSAMNKVYEAVDAVSAKHGKHTLFLGSSFLAMQKGAHEGPRKEKAWRASHILRGENARKHVGIPFLGRVV